jgi:NADH dehydrogenase (ubiquinone) Fe-S protein 1
MDEREPATFWASLKPEVNQKMNSTPFQAAIENFYMTDSITRASKIMAQCSSLLLKK